MALCRIKTIESLRYCAPGEWGKILGLDRIPEVRTLRQTIKVLSVGDNPQKWSARLCAEWMDTDPESAGTLYIDGHVRVYHGCKTTLPRQRLCLRAETDYWVNAMDGRPFCVITKTVDPGLLQVLKRRYRPPAHERSPRLSVIGAVDRKPSFTPLYPRL
jgi:hypothetical protein